MRVSGFAKFQLFSGPNTRRTSNERHLIYLYVVHFLSLLDLTILHYCNQSDLLILESHMGDPSQEPYLHPSMSPLTKL